MLSVPMEITTPMSGRSAWRASSYPGSPRPLSTKATRLVDLGIPGCSSVSGSTGPVAATSVHRRVVGEVRDVREAVALASEHLTPQPLRPRREGVAHLRVDDVPVAAQHLVLELAGLHPE